MAIAVSLKGETGSPSNAKPHRQGNAKLAEEKALTIIYAPFFRDMIHES